MEVFLRSIEFHGVLLDHLFQPELPLNSLTERRRVQELLQEGLHSGVVTPLPFIEYDQSQVEEAFRLMASGKHTGKVLVKIREDPWTTANIPALPRTYFYSHKVYVLVGGLGGVGLEFGNWMIEQGARQLVIASRKGIPSSSWYQKYQIRGWEARGVLITVTTLDMTTEKGVSALLKMARKQGPLGGIFNLAAVLNDALYSNQTSESFEAVFKPKTRTTILLDKLSRKLTPALDFFVAFSSGVCLTGVAGQSNYVFSNSVVERICRERRAAGLHGLAIQLGPVADVGIYHSTTGGEADLMGCAPQRISSVLEVMNVLLKSSEAVVSSVVVASPSSQKGGDELGEKSLVELVARVLGVIDISSINPGDTFTDLGMDSLMATEIKQLLERKLNVSLAPATVMSMTFGELSGMELGPGDESVDVDDGKQVPMLYEHALVQIPKKTIISMESRGGNGSSCLFIVHAIEGNLLMLRRLVQDIDCPVYGFECTAVAPLSSIPALASHYIESMRSVKASGPYRLAGYSYGGAIACEMTIQLEGAGETVERLLMLDGCPQIPRMFSQTLSKYLKMEEGEHLWLLYFLLTHSTQEVDKVNSELLAQAKWEARVDLVAERLSSRYPALSLEEIRELANRFVQSMSAGCSYRPGAKIKSSTTLIRARKTGYDALMGEEYGLNEICASNVHVVTVEGHHNCFYENPTELNIAQIINDALA